MAIADASRAGLRIAAARLAETMRKVAAVRTTRGAAAVNVTWEGDEPIVRAGAPGGKYGWEPIVALMFENNLRHELFGSDKHWYHQGYYPITLWTLHLGLDDAVEAFADVTVPALLDETGF